LGNLPVLNGDLTGRYTNAKAHPTIQQINTDFDEARYAETIKKSADIFVRSITLRFRPLRPGAPNNSVAANSSANARPFW
jgi:hypothetical protein